MIKMFELGKRKIRRMNYSRHISLPKLWLANNNLEDGGVVDLFLGDGNDLIIRPERRKEGDFE